MKDKKLNRIVFYCGAKSLEFIVDEKPFSVFSNDVIKLFEKLSKNLLKLKEIKKFSDLASFAFFCRKNNLLRLKNLYKDHIDKRNGRGLALHFTPSNVPLNFAYSLFFSLISGNVSLIRIGKNNYEQSKLFLKVLNKLMRKNEFKLLSKKISIFNYEKNLEITDYLSKICEIRIIWGGDNSINEVRKSKLSPGAYEITFPNRHSICIISSKDYIRLKKYDIDALNFYNDTLTFDQNACTAPRLIAWLGSKKVNKIARKFFWESFDKILKKKKYKSKHATQIQKVKSQYSAAVELNGIVSKFNKNKNINTSEIDIYPKNLEKFISPGGFFLEYQCKNLKSLKNNISSKLQTITTLGINTSEVFKKLDITNSKGVYRIVPNGRSSDMEMVWDGYEVLFSMSKKTNF